MSNRLFQTIINQMKDVFNRALGVIDENGIIIALDAQADTIEALAAQLVQQLGRNGIRIGFKGDFRIVGHIEATAHGG